MIDVTMKRLDDLECYQGPHAIPGIRFLYAGRGLGITAWGMNVLELEPNCTRYPEHDHIVDGQEEVYLAIRGRATLQASDSEWQLEPGALIRVGPHQKRRIIAGPQGVTVLALGGTPGRAYQPQR